LGVLLCTGAEAAEAQYKYDLKSNVQLATPATEASVTQLTTELASLREAQEKFFAAQGRYTEDLKELVGYAPPSTNSIVMITASAQEWAAVATIPEVVGVVIVRVRRAATPGGDAPTDRR
jgi:hypothetical protein